MSNNIYENNISNNIYDNNISNNIYDNKQIVIESIIHNLIKLNDYSNKYENEMYDFLQFTLKLLKEQKSKHYIEFYNNMPYDIQDIILKNIYNNSKNIYQDMLNELKNAQIINNEDWIKYWIQQGLDPDELINFQDKKGWWKWWELLIPAFGYI